jgi:hypothetical protein
LVNAIGGLIESALSSGAAQRGDDTGLGQRRALLGCWCNGQHGLGVGLGEMVWAPPVKASSNVG